MPVVQAAVVSATGTNPFVCDQTVSDATNVSVTRIAGGDCVIEFKNVGTTNWTAPRISGNARVLVLGGGGGGGAHVGGGGGAGGLIESATATFTLNATVAITVGGGGAGASLFTTGCSNPSTGITGELIISATLFCNYSSSATRSQDGGPSSIVGGGTAITASGGGGGGSWNYFYAHTGGSGGGNSNSGTSFGSGIPGQGNNGGGYSGTYGTGGGGGAGGAGSTGATNAGGNGGAGLTITTFGSTRNLAGGGGGGTHDSGTGGTATHGGGAGAAATSTKAGNGTANTGGGGGGTGRSNAYQSFGGDGGSGLVLIRYTPLINGTVSLPTVAGNVNKGVVVNLSVTPAGPGTVRFFQNGKKIANCLAVVVTGSAPNFTATCPWKPTVSGRQSITAQYTSTDSAISNALSSVATYLVQNRTTKR